MSAKKKTEELREVLIKKIEKEENMDKLFILKAICDFNLNFEEFEELMDFLKTKFKLETIL